MADDGRRRLGDRSKLRAYFGKCDTSADIRDRPQLYRLDEPLEHIVEQLNLFASQAAGGCQKKIGNTPGGFQALFSRADTYRGLDFIDDRLLGIKHCSS